MKKFFVHCDSGSYLSLEHITRLFVETDVVGCRPRIMANVIGMEFPQCVQRCETAEDAETLLAQLVATLEGRG